ncbi:MAG TPA: hypothetical protein VHV78_06325, partial [Gemmatimonadaceae bacterium]|nr:hypothetical protein [Gemmatimonadaceae bacterium]
CAVELTLLVPASGLTKNYSDEAFGNAFVPWMVPPAPWPPRIVVSGVARVVGESTGVDVDVTLNLSVHGKTGKCSGTPTNPEPLALDVDVERDVTAKGLVRATIDLDFSQPPYNATDADTDWGLILAISARANLPTHGASSAASVEVYAGPPLPAVPN